MIPASRPGRHSYSKLPALTYFQFYGASQNSASGTVNLGPAYPGKTIVIAAVDVGSYSARSMTIGGNYMATSNYTYFFSYYDTTGALGTSAPIQFLNAPSGTPTLWIDWVACFSNVYPNAVAYPTGYGDTYGTYSTPTMTSTYGTAGTGYTDAAYPSIVIGSGNFRNSSGASVYDASNSLTGDFVTIGNNFATQDGYKAVIGYGALTRVKTGITANLVTSASTVTKCFYRNCVLTKPKGALTLSGGFYPGYADYIVIPYPGTITASAYGGGGTGIASSSTGWAGGSGGAYASTTISVQAGDKLYFSIPAAKAGVKTTTGLAGGDTWMNKNTNAAPTSATTGLLAKGAGASSTSGAGAPGSAAASVGLVTYSGGLGFFSTTDAACGGGASANSTSNGPAATGAAGVYSTGGGGGAGASTTAKAGTGGYGGGGGGNSRSASYASGGGGEGVLSIMLTVNDPLAH